MASGTVKRATTAAAVMAVALSGCWFGGDDDDDTEPSTTTVAPNRPADDTPIVNVDGVAIGDLPTATPLGIRLSEGAPADATVDAVAVVDGTPISPDDIAAIFERLPAWNVPETDQVEFNRPAQTLPPPLVGDTIDGTFPPPGDLDGPVPPVDGPLEVVRFQPEGDVALAPFLSVTFNQPMVPLATLDQLDEADVPVEVSPTLDGRWRWIGTRTLRFELEPGPIDRLPAATDYEVTVPAGTTSVTGGRLAEAVTWTFSTPPPSVTSFVGETESTSLTPVFVAVFDQRVDDDGRTRIGRH